MAVERYSHVMHIVLAGGGTSFADKTLYDLMRATFPAGTLSGAPKVRAMQIISELEQTRADRTGGASAIFPSAATSIAASHPHGADKDGKAYVQAGGGWVNDSTPEAEYQETVNKAKAMLKALALAESFTRG